jgi:hypothetical protein
MSIFFNKETKMNKVIVNIYRSLILVSLSSCSYINNDPPDCDSEDAKNLLKEKIANHPNKEYRDETILSPTICINSNDNITNVNDYNEMMSNSMKTLYPVSTLTPYPERYLPGKSETGEFESDCYSFFNKRTNEYEEIISLFNKRIDLIEANPEMADYLRAEKSLPELKKLLPIVKRDYQEHLESKNDWKLIEDGMSTFDPFILVSQSEDYKGDYQCTAKLSINVSSKKYNYSRSKDYPEVYYVLYKSENDVENERISWPVFR